MAGRGPRHAGRAAGAILLAAGALLGCGEESPEPRAQPAQARTEAAAAPTEAPAPPAAPAGRPVALRATDGLRLRGTLTPASGAPAPAVVLVHESNGGPEQFADFVPHLHAAGYAVLTYTSREGSGRVDETRSVRDVLGAIRALRRREAIDPERIAVVGASIGASTAVRLAFTRVGDGLPAIVGLSPSSSLDDDPEGREPQDVLLIADESERISADFRAEGHPGITVRTSPDYGHGVALLADARVRGWVLDWLEARLDGGP